MIWLRRAAWLLESSRQMQFAALEAQRWKSNRCVNRRPNALVRSQQGRLSVWMRMLASMLLDASSHFWPYMPSARRRCALQLDTVDYLSPVHAATGGNARPAGRLQGLLVICI